MPVVRSIRPVAEGVEPEVVAADCGVLVVIR
jgi:hypothetical protein